MNTKPGKSNSVHPVRDSTTVPFKDLAEKHAAVNHPDVFQHKTVENVNSLSDEDAIATAKDENANKDENAYKESPPSGRSPDILIE